MKKALLVRHGESTANLEPHIMAGRSNHVELTRAGRAQSRKLGEYMYGKLILPDAVYASPAVRTIVTGKLALSRLPFALPEMQLHDGLQEMTHGVYDGRVREDVLPQKRIDEMNAIGLTAKFDEAEGSESMQDVMDRMYPAVQEIFAETPDGQTIIVFTHGIAIKCLIGKIKGWQREDIHQHKMHNTSVTEIFSDEIGTMSVGSIAATPHLV